MPAATTLAKPARSARNVPIISWLSNIRVSRVDVFSREDRSRIMARVRQKNTKPEVRLRQWLHAAGYRFRLHRRDLPGTPDIVMPGRMAAVFVHGCFWHGHDCKAGRPPATNAEFWENKISKNKLRDATAVSRLTDLGWTPILVWECELRDRATLEARLRQEIPGTPPAQRLP
jgi:DNA mismatch endonuclease (patch repair protein)